MCGRARCTLRVENVPKACGFQHSLPTFNAELFRPSYNVSPGSYMPVVCKENTAAGKEPVVRCMKWGLVPSFSKKNEKPDHFRMFNARSESVHEKASFRRLIPSCRCLVTVEGFYEWKKDGAKKQPFYVHFQDERPLVFAALYDTWNDLEGGVLFTFTILTTRCSNTLKWLHDRMPVILGSKDAIDAWLHDLSSLTFDMVTQPYEASDLVWYPVTPAMGRIQFDGPECVKELVVKPEKKNSIAELFSRHSTPAKSSAGEICNAEAVEDQSYISPLDDLSIEEQKALLAAIEPDKEPNNETLPFIKEEHLLEQCGAKRSFDKTDNDYQLVSQEDQSEKYRSPLESSEEHSSPVTEAQKKKSKSNVKRDGQQTILSFFGRN